MVDISRLIVMVILITISILGYLSLLKKISEEQKKLELLQYENESLKWSYRQMGRYIEKMEIEELADINIRIENELKDIEIRKGYLK